MNPNDRIDTPGVSLHLAVLFATISLLLILPGNAPAVEDKTDKEPEVTGEFRDPEDGEKVSQELSVKGRTRGVPKDFVVLLFRKNLKTGEFFPHTEYQDANRSFSTYLYHDAAASTEWEVHLYVFPEPAAKKLTAWIMNVARLYEAGQKDKVEPYDMTLLDDAIFVTSTKYYVETD